MTIGRRADPLVPGERGRYQAMVHQRFTGRGHGIVEILDRRQPRPVTRKWLQQNGVRASALPKDLTAAQWAALFAAAGG